MGRQCEQTPTSLDLGGWPHEREHSTLAPLLPLYIMASPAPLNQDEKDFLKANFKDEYHFLQQHGLSIYRDEDRVEGREILRALMGAEYEDEEDEEEDNEFDESAKLLMNLSNDENEWAKKHYGGPSAFLTAYGLKQPDVEDAEEGAQILRGLMGKKT